MPEVSVRRGEPRDAREVAEADREGEVALLAEAYPEGYPSHWFSRPPLDPVGEYWTTTFLVDRGDGLVTYVAELDGNVCGYATASRVHDDLARGFVHAMYVHPRAWRHGVGRALAEAIVDHLRELGCRTVELWAVEGSARSRGFYEALGWEATGSFAREGKDPGLPVVEYRKLL